MKICDENSLILLLKPLPRWLPAASAVSFSTQTSTARSTTTASSHPCPRTKIVVALEFLTAARGSDCLGSPVRYPLLQCVVSDQFSKIVGDRFSTCLCLPSGSHVCRPLCLSTKQFFVSYVLPPTCPQVLIHVILESGTSLLHYCVLPGSIVIT